MSAPPDPWATVPHDMRSIVRAYINGNQPQDCARASELCAAYGLDYVAMRTMIREEIRGRLREQIDQAAAPADVTQ